MDNIRQIKKMQSYIVFALILAVISLLASIAKNMVIEQWAKSRDVVACVPTEIEEPFPMVYAQTSAHPIKSDAALKNFVEQYIHAAFNEQAVDFHQISNDGRYDSVRLSASKLKAIEMSMPDSLARTLNMKRYADSPQTLQMLKKCNCGWIFNIDDIIVKQDVNSAKTFVWVRGEFQVTYDDVKVQLPDELWGYREISLAIEQGVPMIDAKGNNLNRDGRYVSFEYTRLLSSDDKEKLTDKKYNFYMKGNR